MVACPSVQLTREIRRVELNIARLAPSVDCYAMKRQSLSRDSVSVQRSFCLSVCGTLYTFGDPLWVLSRQTFMNVTSVAKVAVISTAIPMAWFFEVACRSKSIDLFGFQLNDRLTHFPDVRTESSHSRFLPK